MDEFESGRVDTPETIQKCLHCEKPECDDCVTKNRLKAYKKKTMRKISAETEAAVLNKILRMYVYCDTDQQIADRVGRSITYVRQRRVAIGLPPAASMSKLLKVQAIKPFLTEENTDGQED